MTTMEDPHASLLLKYRELSEKHERLVKRLEAQTEDRLVISRLARLLTASKMFAFGVFEESALVSSNPAWRALGDVPGSRDWRLFEDATIVFPSLNEAVLAISAKPVAAWLQLVRVADGYRIRLRMERVDEEDGRSTFLVAAIDERAASVAMHRARNHLAAAMLQMRLLRDDVDSGKGVSHRAASISELLTLASAALEPGAVPAVPAASE